MALREYLSIYCVLFVHRPYQRESQYPSDLIQLWECHQFLSIFASTLEYFEFGEQQSSPTFKYDSLYTEILSGQSTLVFLLSAKVLAPDALYAALRLFDFSFGVFEPFFAFRDRLNSSVSPEDSLLAFIADPNRAGPLYLDPQATAEILVIRWIT